jgi:hypothetical protein
MSFSFNITRRDLAWATALILLLSTVWAARSDMLSAGVVPPGEGIARVYVAVGTNYPDALGIGPGAGAQNAPIIILPTNPPIPGDTQAELVRLDPREVLIMGGTAAISASMETALGTLLPNATITRIAGADRWATNAEFSEQTFPIEGWISIPAATFIGDHPATDDVVPAFTGTRVWNTTDGILMAPLMLPHGAEILELQADLYDNDEGDLTVSLVAQTWYDSVATVASVSSSGYYPYYHTLATTDVYDYAAIVNNGSNSYRISVTGADGNPFLIQVRIRYRLGVSNG